MEENHIRVMASCSGSTIRPRQVMERNFTFPATSSASTLASPNVNQSSNQPLTIFFNGTVGIFHLSTDQAEQIMEMAEKASMEEDSTAKGHSSQEELVTKLRKDMPIAKKRSLQRFLEKRRERFSTSAP